MYYPNPAPYIISVYPLIAKPGETIFVSIVPTSGNFIYLCDVELEGFGYLAKDIYLPNVVQIPANLERGREYKIIVTIKRAEGEAGTFEMNMVYTVPVLVV